MPSQTFSLLQSIRTALRPLGVEKIAFLKTLYRKFKNSLKQSEADIDGFHLFLDREDSLDLSLSPDYEVFERSLLKDWVRPGDIVLDLGAHIGLFSLTLARLVGEEGRVFSFEPCPESYGLLKQNIAANGFANVTPTQAAVGNRNGKISFFLNPENSGDHRIYRAIEGNDEIEVEIVRLDDLGLLKDVSVDFIKMDIQGGELEALRGMSRLLKESPKAKIFFEFWPDGLRSAGTDPMELLAFFRQCRFDLQHLDESTGTGIAIREGEEPTWFSQMENRYRETPGWHTNLLAERQID